MVEDMNGQEHEVCRTACQALTGWSAWYLSDSKNQILTGMDKLKEEDMREMSLYLKQTELKNEINERWNWAFIWMDVHCEIIGCQQPTTNLTHLDPVFIGELCDEYNAAPANAQYIVYHQEFGNIFRHWLVQVRIRRKNCVLLVLGWWVMVSEPPNPELWPISCRTHSSPSTEPSTHRTATLLRPSGSFQQQCCSGCATGAWFQAIVCLGPEEGGPPGPAASR